MKTSRRHFIKVGGLSIAASGMVSNLIAGCDSVAESKIFEDELKGIEALDLKDYQARISKLKESMQKEEIDALFIEGGTNLKYFFNISWWMSERTFGAIVNTVGSTVWICPAFELERAMEQIPEGDEVRTWEEHESPFKLLSQAITDMGLKGRKVAMGPNVRSFISEAFRRELPATMVDGSMSVHRVRAIKTEKELNFMDVANRITKKAYKYAFDNLSAGMTRSDIAGLIRSAHSDMGVSGSGGPQIGFTSAYPHGTKQVRNLHDGDIVLVDGGCSVEGFRSDVSRTIVFGTPTDKQKRVFDIALKAQQEAHKAVHPGLSCGEIDRVARKVVEDAGFGPGYKYFAHRLGHGIGMDGHEFPYLVKDNPLILEPGMTFSNEPGIYIYGEFGVRIEDCFVVTEDGGRMLGGMLTTGIDKPFG